MYKNRAVKPIKNAIDAKMKITTTTTITKTAEPILDCRLKSRNFLQKKSNKKEKIIKIQKLIIKCVNFGLTSLCKKYDNVKRNKRYY